MNKISAMMQSYWEKCSKRIFYLKNAYEIVLEDKIKMNESMAREDKVCEGGLATLKVFAFIPKSKKEYVLK